MHRLFKLRKECTIQFYLVDAFEIYHFLPLYYIFEENGIYSEFVAENPPRKDARS